MLRIRAVLLQSLRQVLLDECLREVVNLLGHLGADSLNVRGPLGRVEALVHQHAGALQGALGRLLVDLGVAVLLNVF